LLSPVNEVEVEVVDSSQEDQTEFNAELVTSERRNHDYRSFKQSLVVSSENTLLV
jgi:hypothetical protein